VDELIRSILHSNLKIDLGFEAGLGYVCKECGGTISAYNDLEAAVANSSDKRAYGQMAAYHDIVAMVCSLHRV